MVRIFCENVQKNGKMVEKDFSLSFLYFLTSVQK